MKLIITLCNYMLTSNIRIEKERTRTQALRIVTWHFLSTRLHNYVKIAVSKEIYIKLNRKRTKSKVHESYNTRRRRRTSTSLLCAHSCQSPTTNVRNKATESYVCCQAHIRIDKRNEPSAQQQLLIHF